MKLFEHEGKQLLRRMGIATPLGGIVDDPVAAAAAGENILQLHDRFFDLFCGH